MDWEKVGNSDGSINLIESFRISYRGKAEQISYFLLKEVEKLQPIISRQVAAVVIAQAIVLSKSKHNEL